VELIALLIVSMLPIERAETNARLTLHLTGHYGAKLGCYAGDDGYLCTAKLEHGYATLRCSGSKADVCTMQVVK